MENIQQEVRQKIEQTLNQQCGGVKREQIMAQLEGLCHFMHELFTLLFSQT
jgi:DNA-binding transcriptional regulator YbjK